MTAGRWAYKQVIVVRKDLRMGPGKSVAQGAHAAVDGVAEVARTHPSWLEGWRADGQPKVALRVGSLDELDAVCERARAAGLPVARVADAGYTQLEPGTVTCAAIGPAPSDAVDAITGDLSLL
ncbi:MAG: peptidyl-tRNA hydrolase Pth2 [Frankia sp.]